VSIEQSWNNPGVVIRIIKRVKRVTRTLICPRPTTQTYPLFILPFNHRELGQLLTLAQLLISIKLPRKVYKTATKFPQEYFFLYQTNIKHIIRKSRKASQKTSHPNHETDRHNGKLGMLPSAFTLPLPSFLIYN